MTVIVVLTILQIIEQHFEMMFFLIDHREGTPNHSSLVVQTLNDSLLYNTALEDHNYIHEATER